ncbi:hypothetical protein QJS26_gp63 [Serratia phage vB_SmaS_Stoker]|uniref:Uncharacterized protein n=1 Tax=Serratia phage vB_SmaS_Stoker TaxID=2902692 RepID=A0AC61TQU1_9CAUD|nr:hypothetical protein QJS26_gp63 [Serratia phage vB_SmaS_Stoker]UGO53809.1 hypothetical protein STOKER_63 [Serratia phage vB_SmaS_Stoker]
MKSKKDIFSRKLDFLKNEGMRNSGRQGGWGKWFWPPLLLFSAGLCARKGKMGDEIIPNYSKAHE